ncbi:hypothetical protein PFICI_07421 [Pestalotiopsis fici W106-1]|uniref:Uncharacterized protein n=1 Tax=Pestalotiopsis fici (strain W106-1 / CGMCC3.15140) TaxID=1229662 RepID=W3X3C3_PESFW|nr:uncharacterized protein PFICI_07421 [Pestalotiopsis fici W106-1]ETS79892.1 hypothetical protein PFICI_07421 [Pestalotiopsis fici W106-1]
MLVELPGFSLRSPVLRLGLSTTHGVVCAPSQAEKAVYLETQQVWRRAQMNQDYLDKENLGIALHAVGITPGSVMPDDLSSKALSYGASLSRQGWEALSSTSV